MNNWVTVKGHTVSLEIEQESERGLGFIYVKHCCIYRSSLKRFPAPFCQFPLLHFQLALNGWSNAIRSNFSSHVRLLSVCPRLRTDTHSSDGKVRQNSVQLLWYHPFIPPSFHPFILSLVFIHLPLSWDTAARCAPVFSYLPPHLPAHGSLSTTAHYFYFLTTFCLSALHNGGRDTVLFLFLSLSIFISAKALFHLSICSSGYQHQQEPNARSLLSKQPRHSFVMQLQIKKL